MRKKQAIKANKLRILMKNLMYLKNDFVSKLSSRARKCLLRGAKIQLTKCQEKEDIIRTKQAKKVN